MLNNRLEDLIIIYKNYRIKKFIEFLSYLALFILLLIIIYFLYKTILNVSTITSPKKEIKKVEIKEKNISKVIIKRVIIKQKPVLIDEYKILKKNTIDTLMLAEKNKPTYQSAYDLAKYYFEHKDYSKSSKWAVIASNRDEKPEGAWILFAKSKIKLNQKGIAKKSLKIYLLKYHSQKILNLLNSI